jgi:MSHA biogenesis protein MshJ
MTPRATLYRISKQLNTQNPYIKVALLILILGVVAAIGQGILWSLKLQNPMAVDQQIQKVGTENAQLEQSIAQMRNRINNKSLDLALQERLDLQVAVAQVKENLAASTEYLIPPKKMPTILRNLLQKHRKLELIEFVTIEPVSISTHKDALPVFRHGIRIQVKGTYNEMTAWLKEIEQLPWVLNWDHLTYSMQTWPNGLLTLELHTLSREEAWLDI